MPSLYDCLLSAEHKIYSEEYLCQYNKIQWGPEFPKKKRKGE